jgi:hypothetical protein
VRFCGLPTAVWLVDAATAAMTARLKKDVHSHSVSILPTTRFFFLFFSNLSQTEKCRTNANKRTLSGASDLPLLAVLRSAVDRFARLFDLLEHRLVRSTRRDDVYSLVVERDVIARDALPPRASGRGGKGKGIAMRNSPSVFLSTRSMAPLHPEQLMDTLNWNFDSGTAAG